jgi:ring-1,2-phenylacetyl-CoA epoxidase subunit PaaE
LFHVRGEDIRRSYSICSTPGEQLAIGVKRTTNGVISRMLVDQVKPGDVLLTTGAGGFFLAPPPGRDYQRILFFAAGSGITPILPLIKSTLANGYPVALIYSNAAAEKTIFYHDLNALALQYKHSFNIEYLFSNAKNILRSRLERGLLLDLLQQYGKEKSLFYLCGPEIYMLKIQFILLEQGIAKENIRKENFVIHRKDPHANLPADTAAHHVTIEMKEGRKSFLVNYPDTILRAAIKAGITLPYSCETGSCGNCAAICKSGEVWLSGNEVLMDSDLQKGVILTCTGHPINGDVALVYQ